MEIVFSGGSIATPKEVTDADILNLHNTLTGRKEAFVLPWILPMCGSMPAALRFTTTRISAMAAWQSCFDQLVRVLRDIYPCVTYASNITDVDDKIMDAARETGQPIDAITRKYRSDLQ
jgi:cysteinyl-tRNA synthetase